MIAIKNQLVCSIYKHLFPVLLFDQGYYMYVVSPWFHEICASKVYLNVCKGPVKILIIWLCTLVQ